MKKRSLKKRSEKKAKSTDGEDKSSEKAVSKEEKSSKDAEEASEKGTDSTTAEPKHEELQKKLDDGGHDKDNLPKVPKREEPSDVGHHVKLPKAPVKG